MKSCIFCGSTKALTTEDVIPKWARKAFNLHGPVTVTAAGRPGASKRQVGRPMDVLKIVLKDAVCHSCNNAWLGGKIEKSAARLLGRMAVDQQPVDLDGQWITVDRTASESGGRRDIRDDMKTRAAERVVAIADIAMPAVRRLADRDAAGRERSGGELFSRLINGERGGYLGYAMWRRYLALAHGYTASHQDGMVGYTAHELRHVCASLLIASGATDMQVTTQMGHRRIETTKNIYGHLFAQDRGAILKAMNQAVTRLYIQEETDQAA
jgi:Phage integrase family